MVMQLRSALIGYEPRKSGEDKHTEENRWAVMNEKLSKLTLIWVMLDIL